MFRGTHYLSNDVKGRFAVPTRYRDPLLKASSGGLVITVHPAERCLLIYPTPQWDEIQLKIEKLSNVKKNLHDIQLMLMGMASDVEMDGQGRVQIAQYLREYAEIEKKGVLVGQGKRFEYWQEEKWNAKVQDWTNNGLVSDEEMEAEVANLTL